VLQSNGAVDLSTAEDRIIKKGIPGMLGITAQMCRLGWNDCANTIQNVLYLCNTSDIFLGKGLTKMAMNWLNVS
jgi:hypothetical protein